MSIFIYLFPNQVSFSVSFQFLSFARFSMGLHAYFTVCRDDQKADSFTSNDSKERTPNTGLSQPSRACSTHVLFLQSEAKMTLKQKEKIPT